jgi:hypothetical protein
MQTQASAAGKPLKLRKARPDRIRVTLWDAPPAGATPLDLPERRMWPIGILFLVMFAIFAGVAGVSVFKMKAVGEIRDVFSLAFVMFEALWLLGWMVGVVILGLLAVLFLFYGESARLHGRKLVHVARLGPLKILSEYALGRVRNVRVVEAKAEGRCRVRFDYGGREARLGDAMDEANARRIADTLGAAVKAAPMLPDLPPAAEAPPVERASAPAAPGLPPPALTSPSSLALIAANAVPLAGVLLFGWSAGHLMVLFWAESAVIAFYTVLRLIRVSGLGAIFGVPFFIGHYGAFMAAHFLFIYGFFLRGPSASGPEPGVREALAGIFAPLWPALIALFASHGVSFAVNFIGRREYLGATAGHVTTAPYKRIMLMHLAIIGGGWIVLLLDNAVAALVLLIALKIAVDLSAHRKEHASAAAHA